MSIDGKGSKVILDDPIPGQALAKTAGFKGKAVFLLRHPCQSVSIRVFQLHRSVYGKPCGGPGGYRNSSMTAQRFSGYNSWYFFIERALPSMKAKFEPAPWR